MTVKRHFTQCEPYEIHHCGNNSTMAVVWRCGSALISINEADLHRARLVLGWVTVSGFNPNAIYLTRYVTSHPGKLSLAIPSWVGAMSTSQMAVTGE